MPALFFALGRPLFGSMWLAGLTIGAAIVALLVAVALVGRWLAATHPEPEPSPKTPALVPQRSLAPETLAIIAAAVNDAFGTRVQITAVSVAPTHPPSVEALMLQWGLEGRRQIYSSHKVR